MAASPTGMEVVIALPVHAPGGAVETGAWWGPSAAEAVTPETDIAQYDPGLRRL